MHPWNRPQEPAELSAKREELTLAFLAEKKASGKTPACKWPRVINGEGKKETLQDLLSRHTNEHCNYCDGLIRYSSRNTIDHFLPKSNPLFEHLVYEWSNLYLCCDGCQRKGTNYDEKVLRPDETGYLFERYFRFHLDGTISVIAQKDTDRERAKITIRVLKLDHTKLIRNRQQEFHLHAKPRKRPSLTAFNHRVSYSDLPYRDFYA